jgi:hypothetical protein
MSTLQKHPRFTSEDASNMTAGYDFSLSRTTQYLIPTDLLIDVETKLGMMSHINPDESVNQTKANYLIANVSGSYYVAERAVSAGFAYCSIGQQWKQLHEIEQGNNEVSFRYGGGADYDITSRDDKWKFGVEVEKIDCSANRYQAREVLGTTLWSKEQDGSLQSSDGFELVSPLMPLYNDEVIEDALISVRRFLDAGFDDKCGGHFNISNDDEQPIETARRLKHSINLLYGMYPNRVENSYCKAIKFSRMIRSRDKYQAIRMHGNRIEIRLFPAVETYAQMRWRIGLVRILVSETYSGMGILALIKNIMNGKSALSKHFAKIYNTDKLLNMLSRATTMAEKYGNYPVNMIAKCRLVIETATKEESGLGKA